MERLGRIGVTSARNATPVRISQYVRLLDGTRTVEAIASGIPTVLAALRDADMPPPLFDDDGLRFTVVLPRDQSAKTPLVRPGTTTAKVLAALGVGALDVEQIATATALEPANIRRRLRELRTAGLVLQHGGGGLPTTHERVSR